MSIRRTTITASARPQVEVDVDDVEVRFDQTERVDAPGDAQASKSSSTASDTGTA